VSAYCRFCVTKCLNIGVCICLIEVSAECCFIFNYCKCGKKILGLIKVGVDLKEGVRLIWGLPNAGFTVNKIQNCQMEASLEENTG